MTEHPGEMFLRGVTKRYQPPFTIELPRRPDSPYRLVDAAGLVIRRFTRYSYAFDALCALCARHEIEPPRKVEAQRRTREASYRYARDREAAAKEAAGRRRLSRLVREMDNNIDK